MLLTCSHQGCKAVVDDRDGEEVFGRGPDALLMQAGLLGWDVPATAEEAMFGEAYCPDHRGGDAE